MNGRLHPGTPLPPDPHNVTLGTTAPAGSGLISSGESPEEASARAEAHQRARQFEHHLSGLPLSVFDEAASIVLSGSGGRELIWRHVPFAAAGMDRQLLEGALEILVRQSRSRNALAACILYLYPTSMDRLPGDGSAELPIAHLAAVAAIVADIAKDREFVVSVVAEPPLLEQIVPPGQSFGPPLKQGVLVTAAQLPYVVCRLATIAGGADVHAAIIFTSVSDSGILRQVKTQRTAEVQAAAAAYLDADALNQATGVRRDLRGALADVIALWNEPRAIIKERLEAIARGMAEDSYDTHEAKRQVAVELSSAFAKWGFVPVAPATGLPSYLRTRQNVSNARGYFYFESVANAPRVQEADPSVKANTVQLPLFSLTDLPDASSGEAGSESKNEENLR